MGERFTRSDGYNGSAVRRYRAAVFAAYGTTCHLCGRGGADTADHVIPRSVRPDLAFDVANGRPAHKSCNSARRERPLADTYMAPSW